MYNKKIVAVKNTFPPFTPTADQQVPAADPRLHPRPVQDGTAGCVGVCQGGGEGRILRPGQQVARGRCGHFLSSFVYTWIEIKAPS